MAVFCFKPYLFQILDTLQGLNLAPDSGAEQKKRMGIGCIILLLQRTMLRVHAGSWSFLLSIYHRFAACYLFYSFGIIFSRKHFFYGLHKAGKQKHGYFEKLTFKANFISYQKVSNKRPISVKCPFSINSKILKF